MRNFFRKRTDTATSAPSPPPRVKNLQCPVCKSLDPNFFEVLPLRSPRLRIDCATLRQSAGACPSCNLLVKIQERYSETLNISPKGIRLEYDDGTLLVALGANQEVMLYADRPTPWTSIAVREHVTGPNSSGRSLEYVKRMLQTCSHEHVLCRRRESASLPTRLLDLGCPSAASEMDTIRLWETKVERDPGKVEYACLSHCWGGCQPVTTLTGNLEEQKSGIRLQSLPTTFVDAIDFTRRLGVRYIWIDSLCIIQDDGLDWEREAAQMSNVYQNCVICLGSPAATNPSSGLYSKHTVNIETFKSVELLPKGSSTPSSQPWNVFARQKLSHSVLQDPSDIPLEDPGHDGGTLRFRGWVYQERMLAPRFLNFLDEELAWDCRSVSTCECGDQVRDSGALGSMGSAKRAFASELQAASPEAMADVWRKMVSSYTKLYLTKEKDRLLAIAGVAHMFEEARSPASRYCEGIWSDSAVQDLTWEVWWGNKEGESRVRNEELPFPSWSWASVSASIGYPSTPAENFKSLCTIVDIRDGGSPSTGKGKQPMVTIHGHMVPAVLEYRGQQAETNLRPYTLRFVGQDKKRGFPEDESVELSGPGHVPDGGTVYYLILGKDRHEIYHSMIIKEMNPRDKTYWRIGLARNGRDVFEGRIREKTSLHVI